jgi:hypothetical protein
MPGTKAKIIARNTFRFTAPDGAIVTRLHQTDIVRALPKGRYQLDSKGWRTVTTKDRMASSIGQYRIWADKGSWYVGNGSLGTVPYYDGMILPDAFKHKAKAGKLEAKEQALRKQVKMFCAKLDKLTELPAPSNGDCWYCSMRVTAPAKDKGKALGDATGDNSHILEHVKEGYLHGSMIWNALESAGYREPAVIWQMENDYRKRGQKTDFAKRALRKYLYRKLGLVA